MFKVRVFMSFQLIVFFYFYAMPLLRCNKYVFLAKLYNLLNNNHSFIFFYVTLKGSVDSSLLGVD